MKVLSRQLVNKVTMSKSVFHLDAKPKGDDSFVFKVGGEILLQAKMLRFIGKGGMAKVYLMEGFLQKNLLCES